MVFCVALRYVMLCYVMFCALSADYRGTVSLFSVGQLYHRSVTNLLAYVFVCVPQLVLLLLWLPRPVYIFGLLQFVRCECRFIL